MRAGRVSVPLCFCSQMLPAGREGCGAGPHPWGGGLGVSLGSPMLAGSGQSGTAMPIRSHSVSIREFPAGFCVPALFGMWGKGDTR